MSQVAERRVPLLLWPFYAVWRLLTFVLALTGRLVAFVLGTVLLISGALVTATVVGAPLGVVLAGIGVLLLLRSIF